MHVNTERCMIHLCICFRPTHCCTCACVFPQAMVVPCFLCCTRLHVAEAAKGRCFAVRLSACPSSTSWKKLDASAAQAWLGSRQKRMAEALIPMIESPGCLVACCDTNSGRVAMRPHPGPTGGRLGGCPNRRGLKLGQCICERTPQLWPNLQGLRQIQSFILRLGGRFSPCGIVPLFPTWAGPFRYYQFEKVATPPSLPPKQ